MSNLPSEITEFFGVFLAYSDIMERSPLFGKFPLHWDPTKYRLLLDFNFARDYKSLIKIGLLFGGLFFPAMSILLRWLSNKFQLCAHFEDNVPYDVICAYIVAVVMFLSICAVLIPIVFLWKIYAGEESFAMFQRLSNGKFPVMHS